MYKHVLPMLLLALSACAPALPSGEWRGTLRRFREDGQEHSRRWPAPVVLSEDGTINVTDWYEVAEPVSLSLSVTDDNAAQWSSGKEWKRPNVADCTDRTIVYEKGTVEVKEDGALEVHADVRLLGCPNEARMSFIFTGTQDEPPMWSPCPETEPGHFCTE